MTHHNKTINTLKLHNRLLWCFIALLVIVIGGSYYESHKYLSPCPEDMGCFVKVVYAQDELNDIEQISAYMAKSFGPYGLDVLTQAFMVAKNESGWNKNAKGWNCHYTVDGKQISTSCKVEDRSKAWSVDCGLMQINVKGLECPSKLMNIKENIDTAVKMYKTRKWQPWVAAKTLGYVN